MHGKRLHHPDYILILLFLFIGPVSSLFPDYPRIQRLNDTDVLFSQLESSIQEYYKAEADSAALPPLSVYVYRTKEKQSIFTLSAQFNLPFESIATINRIDTPSEIAQNTELLIPSVPGIFLPFSPRTEFEEVLLASKRSRSGQAETMMIILKGNQTGFHFLPGERFTADEFSFFLGVRFRSPIDYSGARISSYYGMRKNPLGKTVRFHHGIDIAAPDDTPVLAAREGTVIRTGRNAVYGNFILLKHEDGYKSFYGHLDIISVQLNQKVKSGSIIGRLGTTGMSTGPHLHFEIWKRDKSVDPLPLLPRQY